MSIVLDLADGPLNNGAAAAAGAVPIVNGASSVSAVFTMALLNINYSVVFSFANLIDANPIDIHGWMSAFSITGFTAKLSAPVPTGNYTMSYIVTRNV